MSALDTATQDRTCAAGWKGWLAVFAGAMAVYLFTLAPDLVWQDQGDYQYVAAKCRLSIPGDLVRVHPLYILAAHAVGRLGFFSYAYAANLVDAICTAVTVANVYMLIMMLAGGVWPAVLGAAVFGMAHSVWFLGVQAQTYGMALAAMSGGLVCALSYLGCPKAWKLFLMGLCFGLGVSVHLMSQIAFGAIMALLLWRVVRGRLSAGTYIGIIALWIIGAAALWIAAWIEYRYNHSIVATVHSAIVGKWGKAVFNTARIMPLVTKSAGFFVLNFPTPLALLAVPGLWLSFKRLDRTAAGLLLACTILYFGFAARYDIPNQNNFFLPFYMFVGIYIGLGFIFVAKRHIRRWAIVCGVLAASLPCTYLAIEHVAKANGIFSKAGYMEQGVRRHIPYRDVYEYYLLPWQQHQTGPRRLVTEVMNIVPQGAYILPDMILAPFQYAHEIEGLRPDVHVLAFGDPNCTLQEIRASGARAFTFSDIKNYYPAWVTSKDWLKPLAISPAEKIFEIVIPAE